MKRKFTLFLAVALLASVFTACKKDNGDDDDKLDTGLNNQLEYNGTKYALKSGFVTDYGSDEAHYNYDFELADGTFDNEGDSDNSTVEVYFELYSSGSSSFKTGTFQFITATDDDEITDAKFSNKNFFSYGDILIDKNSDMEFDDNEVIEVTGGTVIVSGTARNYTVEFDVSLEDGKKAKGKFSGSFGYYDDRDDDISRLSSKQLRVK